MFRFPEIHIYTSVQPNRIRLLRHIVLISLWREFEFTFNRINISALIVVPALTGCSSGVIAY